MEDHARSKFCFTPAMIVRATCTGAILRWKPRWTPFVRAFAQTNVSTTYFQFQASLEEWMTREAICLYAAELLSMYAHGVPVHKAASVLASIPKSQRVAAQFLP